MVTVAPVPAYVMPAIVDAVDEEVIYRLPEELCDLAGIRSPASRFAAPPAREAIAPHRLELTTVSFTATVPKRHAVKANTEPENFLRAKFGARSVAPAVGMRQNASIGGGTNGHQVA